MTCSVFIATSLDGFIAREDGAIDWLTAAGNGEDYGYADFIATVDALVMGRNTYELVLTFGGWPYEGTPVVVLSSRALDIPDRLAGRVEHMHAPPREVVRRLADRGASHLYVDGGRTIQAFLADGLIRRLTLTRIPVLLGRGIPLFGPLPGDVHLDHLETRTWPNGFVQSAYELPGTESTLPKPSGKVSQDV
jgi:dihydrofolate reductase